MSDYFFVRSVNEFNGTNRSPTSFRKLEPSDLNLGYEDWCPEYEW